MLIQNLVHDLDTVITFVECGDNEDDVRLFYFSYRFIHRDATNQIRLLELKSCVAIVLTQKQIKKHHNRDIHDQVRTSIESKSDPNRIEPLHAKRENPNRHRTKKEKQKREKSDFSPLEHPKCQQHKRSTHHEQQQLQICQNSHLLRKKINLTLDYFFSLKIQDFYLYFLVKNI